MNRFLGAGLVAALAAASAGAADVGVSVTVGEPGFYGTIDIGNFPPPQVIHARPVIVQAAPAGVVLEPLYLRVPPGHLRHWSRHCAEYHACDRPVYFVRDSWYEHTYVPAYRAREGRRDDGDRGRDRRGDEGRRDHGRGHGEGRGHED